MGGYVKTFKVKDEDNYKNNKLISFWKYDQKLLEKNLLEWDWRLKNIELNTLPVYDNWYIKT